MSMSHFLIPRGCSERLPHLQVSLFQLSGLVEAWQSQQCEGQSKSWYLTPSLVPTPKHTELNEIRPWTQATLTQSVSPCPFFYSLSTSSHVLPS